MVSLECPWCGKNANLELQGTEEGFYIIQMRCSNKKCNATCPHGAFSTAKMSMKEAEKKAMEQWNKRAPKRGI